MKSRSTAAVKGAAGGACTKMVTHVVALPQEDRRDLGTGCRCLSVGTWIRTPDVKTRSTVPSLKGRPSAQHLGAQRRYYVCLGVDPSAGCRPASPRGQACRRRERDARSPGSSRLLDEGAESVALQPLAVRVARVLEILGKLGVRSFQFPADHQFCGAAGSRTCRRVRPCGAPRRSRRSTSCSFSPGRIPVTSISQPGASVSASSTDAHARDLRHEHLAAAHLSRGS